MCTVSAPPFYWRDNFQSETLKTGDTEETECLGDLKSSCDRYLPGGFSMFLVKKVFAIFSNLMFSFGSAKSLEQHYYELRRVCRLF